MQNYKKFSILVLGYTFLLLGLFFVAFYLYDPMQIFHKPFFREPTFSREMRLQNKGIIDHYDFDSYIIGDSLTQNTPAGYAQYRLGDKWVNITPVGASFYEKFVILDYLFRKKHDVKNIIYGLNVSMVDKSVEQIHFGFLYDKNPLNDIRAYINRKYINCLLSFSKKPKCVGQADLENLTHWMDDPHTLYNLGNYGGWFQGEGIKKEIERLKVAQKKIYHFVSTKNIDDVKEYIQKYVFSLVVQNPKVHFYFLIPVYPTYFYKVSNEEYVARYFKSLRWFVQESTKYPNVKIYGFGNDNYTDDIKNYKDHVHHSMDMNVKQIDAIAEGSHIVNNENIDIYLKNLQDRVQKYNVKPLIDILEKRL
ncbi:hypothetical protein LW135_04745 [Helicobacter sp. faydin-H20]|uniref:hypothetical protein n=1 Tax=Helicobacter anatolicus TaxID=2905874 RepID=UPI001E5CAE4F|nr:hypothetical protein [Helicobacter anatolicus]MCE3037134.1 hypothetical protein [Helicobacter anatolicus]